MHTSLPTRLLITAVILSAQVLRGHDPGLSTAVVRVTGEGFEARLTLSPMDVQVMLPLDADGDGQVDAEEFESASASLTRAVKDSFEIAVDDRAISIGKVDVSLQVEEDNIHARLLFEPAAGERLLIRSRWLGELPFGHRQYLAIVDRNGQTIETRLLDAENMSAAVHLSPGTRTDSQAAFGDFFTLGVEHIVTGYDHLLFLLALLIGGGSLVASAKIITSFTVAHSITLAVAVFGLVELSSGFVEAMIALSIIYVGAENLLDRRLGRRWIITFAFGHVHGFGFASILREVGLGSGGGGVALPLLSFNLGVEVGQVALAMIILPFIWQLQRRSTSFELYARPASIAIVILGTHWLVERTLLS